MGDQGRFCTPHAPIVLPHPLLMSSQIAEILDHEQEHDKTEAGNYFVATYPPFSFWNADMAARVQGL
jgi:hypothetical protein